MSQARAKKIKLLLFDVDGVLTDGKLFFFPAPAAAEQTTQAHAARHSEKPGYAIASASMVEAKGFHAHDGTAISLARLGGLQTGLITKRISETVALRARDLHLDHVHQGIKDKLGTFHEILQQAGFEAREAAFVGDDIIDLPVMRACGLAIAVPNARAEVKKEAHFITSNLGGEGALRDAVEHILRSQGRLRQVIAAYIASRRTDI
jgi:3-deoxy-D-manno-octulosonate 8-phosphate phosphatase (KDO 8-P phosphatase)